MANKLAFDLLNQLHIIHTFIKSRQSMSIGFRIADVNASIPIINKPRWNESTEAKTGSKFNERGS